MTWGPNIARWRDLVRLECKDFPPDLILSIIRHESGGIPGEKSGATTKSATIPTDSGGSKTVNRALGLMQVIGSNIATWNEKKSPTLTWEDMTGSDERAARLQIRIGCSILAAYLNRLHKFAPSIFPGTTPGTATTNQLALALLAYRMGPGKPGGKKGLIPRLEILRDQGVALNLQNVAKAFPKWGWSEKKKKWVNRPNHYGKSVWAAYQANEQHHDPNDTPTPIPKPNGRWLIPVGIAALLLGLLISQQKGRRAALT